MLTRAITAEEIETYDRDGIVCLRGLFNTDTVEMLREAAEQCMTAEPANRKVVSSLIPSPGCATICAENSFMNRLPRRSRRESWTPQKAISSSTNGL